jgi:hypothetical protein
MQNNTQVADVTASGRPPAVLLIMSPAGPWRTRIAGSEPLAAIGSSDEPQRVVLSEYRDSALIITINRPDQRSAINAAVAAAPADACTELDETPALRLAIVQGAGGTFCAGLDLKAAARGERASVPGRGFAGLVEAPPAKPVIATVEGWSLGGGFARGVRLRRRPERPRGFRDRREPVWKGR